MPSYGPLRKQKFTTTGSKGHWLWLADFHPSVCFCVSRLVVLNFRVRVFPLFYLAHKFFLLAYWNTAILDFQGEIAPIDLPNPEDTQIWVGENKLLHSRQHQFYFCCFRSLLLPLFDKYGLDAMVTVWLTWKKSPKSWNVLDNAGRELTETAENRQTETFQSNS